VREHIIGHVNCKTGATKWIATQLVKPCVVSNKNDATDAEAVCEAQYEFTRVFWALTKDRASYG